MNQISFNETETEMILTTESITINRKENT